MKPVSCGLNKIKLINYNRPYSSHLGVKGRYIGVLCSSEATKDIRSEEYSKEMEEKMGGNAKGGASRLIYDHGAGINYDRITDKIIVGSCLHKPEHVDRLKDEGVSLIVCLQQDTDMAYFDIDIEPVQKRAEDVDVKHVRLRINDMDALNLRLRLPDVIKELHQEVQALPTGTIYVHCTAGMGRAPAVALAYMWWVQGIHLDEAHKLLVSRRFCSPSLSAIREATTDILYGGDRQDITIHKKGTSNSEVVEIAGLDVGWGGRIQMEKVIGDSWTTTRSLLPGRYLYKYVMDGVWSYDADQYHVSDGFNINNVIQVVPKGLTDEEKAARARILREDGRLTNAEQSSLHSALQV